MVGGQVASRIFLPRKMSILWPLSLSCTSENCLNHSYHLTATQFSIQQLKVSFSSTTHWGYFMGCFRAVCGHGCCSGRASESSTKSAKSPHQCPEIPCVSCSSKSWLTSYLCLATRRFLSEVESHSDENKMTALNLATIFGPNILRPQVKCVLCVVLLIVMAFSLDS